MPADTESRPGMPGVSVIIPAFNYGRYLAAAIDSALSQQVDCPFPVEVVVVDDGSDDETPAVCEKYQGRVRWFRQQNAGLSAARNRGMREAGYDHVVFLDADDMLPPRTIPLMTAALALLSGNDLPNGAGKQTIGLIAGQRQVFADDTSPGVDQRAGETITLGFVSLRDLLLRSQFPCTVLADRRMLLALEGFDEDLPASEDRDMWIRLAAAGHRLVRLDHVVLWNREHPGQMSRKAEQQAGAVRRVLQKAKTEPRITSAVPSRTWAQAEAVCLYQEALMHRDSGALKKTFQALLRSFAKYPGPLPGLSFSREKCFLITLVSARKFRR